MLTYAIGFIQNTQLVSFAIVFILMSIKDRTNRSVRWLAYTYLSGLVGSILQFGTHHLPDWASVGLFMETAPIGFACIHACMVDFTGRGARTRWIHVALIAATLPFCLLWSGPDHVSRITTLTDCMLSIQTALTAWLLFSTHDPETLWPRRTLGGFLAVYSAVEAARVVVYLHTGKTADLAAPWIEVASGMVYVVSCSVLPLAIIWMMNVRLHAHMQRQMLADPLTQLVNRRGLEHACEVELARYQRYGHDFAIAMMDLDHFKQFNDTFGHAGGDAVLCEIASLLRGMVRTTDTIGRLGGEEFVLLFPAISSTEAKQLIERLRVALADHTFQLGKTSASVTSSFGIAVSAGRKDLTWETLLKEADLALYTAKRAGRNLSEVYREDHAFPAHPTLSPSLPVLLLPGLRPTSRKTDPTGGQASAAR